MYKLNNKVIHIGTSFTYNDILYPRNWLQKSTETERSAIGIVWENDPVLSDDKYYWNGDANMPKDLEDVLETDDEGNPIYVQEFDQSANAGMGAMVNTDQQLVRLGLKTTMTKEVKETADSLLSQTDWYVTRKSEKDIAIPTDVTTKRDAIRTECNRLETAIAAATTVEELKSVMESQNWGN